MTWSNIYSIVYVWPQSGFIWVVLICFGWFWCQHGLGKVNSNRTSWPPKWASLCVKWFAQRFPFEILHHKFDVKYAALGNHWSLPFWFCVIQCIWVGGVSVRPKWVNTEYTEYRSFGILTEPNNTEPNLIIEENKGSPPTMFKFPPFYCIFMWHFFSNFLEFFFKIFFLLHLKNCHIKIQ